MRLAVLALATVLAGSAFAAADGEFVKSLETWRSGRLERLTAPEGWLSLVGLHWIEPGSHTVGSAKDNGIVLAVGPAHLGRIVLDGKTVHLTLNDGVEAQIGDTAQRSGDLLPDASGTPTKVHFGTANFIVIERSGRFALRVKDSEAATRKNFAGLDYFDTDAAWRVDARFEPHAPGKTIDIATVIGTIEPMANPGAVVFEKAGKTHRLEAVDEGDGELFLIFADRTNGKESYGPGRFVYAHPPAAGSDHVVLDFNQAYNPPCSFTPHATCPLPPPENRLDLAVTAGEKKYKGAGH